MTKNLIPSINISSILKEGFDSPKSIKTINKIMKACVNVGFFQVTGHGISQKKISNIWLLDPSPAYTLLLTNGSPGNEQD